MLAIAKEISYDGPVIISNNSRTELMWWVNNITTAFIPIIQDNLDITITTDASSLCWGTVNLDTKQEGFGI